MYAGSCVFPATKPGGNALLVHALETGVRVLVDRKELESKVVALRFARGVAYQSLRQSQQTLIHFENQKAEPFELIVDHKFSLRDPTYTATLCRGDAEACPVDEVEQLENGRRLEFTLPPKKTVTLDVKETAVRLSKMKLVHLTKTSDKINVGWIEENVVATNGPLSDRAELRAILDIQRRLEDKRREISAAEAARTKLESRQERLRKNLATGGHDEQSNRWKTDLGQAEERIVAIDEETLPQLRTDEQAIRDELRDALTALAVEWKEGG